METNEEKLKECHELVNKINETFGIKINGDKRDASIVWFRHYITDKYKKDALRVTYEPLNRYHATIGHARRLLHKLVFKQEFIDITEVIETLDVNLYKQFIDTHVKKRYDTSKTKPGHEANIKKLQMPTGQAMILLRKNPKSALWNKKIANWSYQDWQELKTY